MMRKRDLFLAGLATLLVWQAAAMLLRLDILPTPAQVLVTFVEQLPRGLGRHFAVSGARVVASLGLAVLLATPAGLVLGQSARLNRIFSPFVYVVYPIPKIVFLPIVLLWLGIGDASKIFIIFLILFFQVLVVVRDEASGLRPELIASVRSLGAGRRALFRYVYLPATIPAMLTALRVSVGTAVAVLFFAESFATTSGLGYYIFLETWTRMAYREMYAGVVAMSLLGLGLYYLIDRMERRWVRWMFVS
jgi:ABC-type nitrate/sulfonate/bicarbonate transport system permease component